MSKRGDIRARRWSADTKRMTSPSRTWAVLTIAVLAAVTAGCSSPADAPTARAKSTTSTQSKAKTPAAPAKSKVVAAKLTYCAPLAVWNTAAINMPRERTAQELAMKKIAPMLDPAIAAATADGRTDVAAFFSLMKVAFADPANVTDQEGTAAIKEMTKFRPVFLKDCGIKFGKY